MEMLAKPVSGSLSGSRYISSTASVTMILIACPAHVTLWKMEVSEWNLSHTLRSSTTLGYAAVLATSPGKTGSMKW